MKTATALALATLFTTLESCVAPPIHANPAEVASQSPSRSYFNVPFLTLGGKQWWADELWESGWRIQKSVVSGHHRLLDPGDVRRGWGNYAGCVETLQRFREDGVVEPVSEHIVVCLHGIWRSKDSMRGLERAAREAGYQVANLNYPSTSWSIEDCAIQIERVLSRLPTAVERISFVTHSMGGLVTRQILGFPADEGSWRERVTVDRLVMIFPPNQGASQADTWHRRWWYRGVMGPAGQQLTTETAPHLPIPAVPTGIIAGGRNDGAGRSSWILGDDDGTVAVHETELEGADHLVLDVGHTFGMNDEETISAVLRFLADGGF